LRWGTSQRCPRLYCARVAICAHKIVVVLVIAPHSAPAPAPPRMGNPPPEPIVLRGHGADVQCLCFVTLAVGDGDGDCLLSGDSNGDVVSWDLGTRRPRWRLAAHPPSSGVLSVGGFCMGKQTGDISDVRNTTAATHLLTQGRDGSLKCWVLPGSLRDHEEAGGFPSPTPLWSVTTGSFHFCKFAATRWGRRDDGSLVCGDDSKGDELRKRKQKTTQTHAIAVVGNETSAVDVLLFRGETEGSTDDALPKIITTVAPMACDDRNQNDDNSGAPAKKLGTVMATTFVEVAVRGKTTGDAATKTTLLLVGYEEGTLALFDLEDDQSDSVKKVTNVPLWREKSHGDAVTCVANDPTRGGWVSASADGGLLRFTVDAVSQDGDGDPCGGKSESPNSSMIKVNVVRAFDAQTQTREDSFATPTNTHGIASLSIRDDGKVFATGGWDGVTKVYSRKAGGRGKEVENESGQKKKTVSKKKTQSQKIAALKFHDDVVACVAFRTVFFSGGRDKQSRGSDKQGPDKYAGWLATGSRDGAVALWPVFPPKIKE
jgi:WD40 repeat protein